MKLESEAGLQAFVSPWAGEVAQWVWELAPGGIYVPQVCAVSF